MKKKAGLFPAFLTICTGARFAFIGLLLCYVVYFVGVIKKRWVIFVSLLVILAVALLLFVLFPSSALVRRFNDLLSTIFGGDMFDGSTSVRLSMVRDGLSLFSKNTLFGYGLGGFDANVSYQMSHSHCTIIELLVDCGLIGSSFYFLSLYFALRWPPKKMVTLIFIVVSIPCFLFTVIMSNKFYLSFLGLLSSTCLHEIPFTKIK